MPVPRRSYAVCVSGRQWNRLHHSSEHKSILHWTESPRQTQQMKNPEVKWPFVSIPVMWNTRSLIWFLLNSIDFHELRFNPIKRNHRTRSQMNSSFSAIKITAGKHAWFITSAFLGALFQSLGMMRIALRHLAPQEAFPSSGRRWSMANLVGQSDQHCWVPRGHRHPELQQETGREN